MSNGLSRRGFLGATGASVLAAPALAQSGASVQWRMVTSWPKNLPGPGVTANRLAERINVMSGGALSIQVYGAGELVPGLQVFDAVAAGTAQMGHSASFFWQGKMKSAPFFTSIPFGLTPIEHQGWIYHGGGQELWDELYAPFGVMPFMAGNTGMSMGGWYKSQIESLDDIKGLKIRMPGLGGEVMRRLGATPVSIPPSEISSSLQSGLIDATEFLGPFSDRALGLYKVASFYHWPGFHEPNGTGEALVSRAAYDALPKELQEIVVNACAAENSFSLAEIGQNNARSLELLVLEDNVHVVPFPDEVITAAREISMDVLAEFDDGGATIDGRIFKSNVAASNYARNWSGVSMQAYLKARNG